METPLRQIYRPVRPINVHQDVAPLLVAAACAWVSGICESADGTPIQLLVFLLLPNIVVLAGDTGEAYRFCRLEELFDAIVSLCSQPK